MAEISMPYLRKTYYALALDPVHIGSGEMQMGRVDNPIIRDAASGLPKIPATSLAGVARTYTAMHYPEKYRRPVEVRPGVVGYASCADPVSYTHL
ncbi:MAG: RAMP superfamily CRISPR-associated protein, partial [Anaerolineae bacterium]|nr:RAMP superfamily CRISPR-associated protein [Anaerolineae bacterium]